MVEHYKPNLTRTQRSNLRKLADFLENNDVRFHMGTFFHEADRKHTVTYVYPDPAETPALYTTNHCGTVGCAVGWGPTAGIEALHAENWHDYISRCFVGRQDNNRSHSYPGHESHDVYQFLFDIDWVYLDNTKEGAIKRIRYLLKHGIPIGHNPFRRHDAQRGYQTSNDFHKILRGRI